MNWEERKKGKDTSFDPRPEGSRPTYLWTKSTPNSSNANP